MGRCFASPAAPLRSDPSSHGRPNWRIGIRSILVGQRHLRSGTLFRDATRSPVLIVALQAKGNVYKGRPATIDPRQIVELRDQGLGATAIAQRLKIGWASVYRALAA
jgi:hypothetical protein